MTTQAGPGKRLETLVAQGMEDNVLVRVNGKAITQYDLNLWQLAEGLKEPSKDEQQKLLDRIIVSELMSQKGQELGLDKDPAFTRAMALAEAKILMIRRQEIQRMVREREAASVQVSDEEAKGYYARNEKTIRGNYHIGSLQFTTEQEARAVLDRIEKGESFEEVADAVVRSMPGTVPGQELSALWDLGFISWRQIPPEIMTVVEKMEPGEVNGPVEHEQAGYIVLKLIELESVEEADFPSLRQEIISRLQQQATREHLEKFRQELKANAKLEILAEPQEVNIAPAPSFH